MPPSPRPSCTYSEPGTRSMCHPSVRQYVNTAKILVLNVAAARRGPPHHCSSLYSPLHHLYAASVRLHRAHVRARLFPAFCGRCHIEEQTVKHRSFSRKCRNTHASLKRQCSVSVCTNTSVQACVSSTGSINDLHPDGGCSVNTHSVDAASCQNVTLP